MLSGSVESERAVVSAINRASLNHYIPKPWDEPDLRLAVENLLRQYRLNRENRKLLVFPISQLPEMGRGKGVRLQRYKDGGLSDGKVFAMKDGLTWKDSSGRTWTVEKADLRDWIGNRAEAGRLPPKGFPKNNRFG